MDYKKKWLRKTHGIETTECVEKRKQQNYQRKSRKTLYTNRPDKHRKLKEGDWTGGWKINNKMVW